MIKAVIFDIDGTLVDSVDFHAEAWQRAFRQFGKEIPFEDVRHQIGKGSDQLLPIFFSEEELAEFGEEMEKYRGEVYKSEYLPRVQAFPNVLQLFRRVKQDGKQIVLASSAKADELEAYKKITGVAEFIEGETSADDTEKSKPHPDIFQAALDKLTGVEAQEAIVIGDTPYDVQAARKINLRTVGVLCGGFPEMELREAGAVSIYHDCTELLKKYDESLLAKDKRIDDSA